MQKYQKPGLQELVVLVPLCLVLVPLCLVPVPNRFWRVVPVPLWMVPVPFSSASVIPVPPLFGTGTKVRFCPEMAEFTLFHSPFFHNSLLFHPSSKTNMESLQTTPQTLLISQIIQGLILKFTKLYKTIQIGRIPYLIDIN